MTDEELHWAERAKQENLRGFPPVVQGGALGYRAPEDRSFLHGGWSRGSFARIILAFAIIFAVLGGGLGILHLYNNVAGNGAAVDTTINLATPVAQAGDVSSGPPQGWVRHSEAGAEIYLPASFDLVVDADTDLALFVEHALARSPEWASLAQSLEQMLSGVDMSSFVLWVADSSSTPASGVTNMNIVREKVPTNMTVDQYAGLVLGMLPAEWSITDKAHIMLNGREAIRLVADIALPDGLAAFQSTYIVKGSSEMWVLSFTAPRDRLPFYEADFAKAAATFRVGR